MRRTKVSIISVNYNGLRLLPSFLDSIYSLDYPKQDLEVIIVDNGSTDGSVKKISKDYPWVKLVKLKTNIGFGAGNNVGIRQATGDFVLLLNNDTYPAKDILKSLLNCWERWSERRKVASVSAKLVLYDRYLMLRVEDAYFHDYSITGGGTPINDQVYVVKPVNDDVYIIRDSQDDSYREKVFIPLPKDLNGPLSVEVTLKNVGGRGYKLYVNDKLLVSQSPNGKSSTITESFNLSETDIKENIIDLIQNAGNFIFRDGYSRDRGVEIYGGEQLYESDQGQYNKTELLPAFCGAAVLLNKKALDDVGLFDQNFFMYYEDIDLSLRFKERGWSSVYCPTAVVRHMHSASSKEWSPFFVYNVERGRMFLVLKHWPYTHALWEWIKYLIKDTLAVPMHHIFFAEIREFALKLRLRIKVNIYLITTIPNWLFNRKRLTSAQLKRFL